MFDPETPWVPYTKCKDYTQKSRTSTRGFFTLFSEVEVRCDLDFFYDVLIDHPTWTEWDKNLSKISFDWIMEPDRNNKYAGACGIIHYTSIKILVVSPRDFFGLGKLVMK